jgi:ADP-ribosylglycohydrolase/fructose-1,6-bisphosphatase/inositol monophosphatase family enzyme
VQELLKNVVALARQAGEMIRQELYRDGGPRGFGDKADVDVEVEAYLSAQLSALLPGSGVVGEELGQSGDPGAEYCWLVDPHDGTSAFLRGFRGSSVSIGLLQFNKPVLGVVYAPLFPNDHGDLIAGGPGLGLWRNDAEWSSPPSVRPLGPSDIVALSQDADCRSQANIQAVAPARFLAMPSIAYRLALAAVGDARVGQSLVYLAAHDVAAAHALLLAAGKVLRAWEDVADDPLVYTPYLRSVPVIGGDPVAVEEVRPKEPGAVLFSSQTQPLSILPGTRRWQSAGLSLDRAQGCLLGQLAGDSLGSLVEFKSAGAIAAAYPDGPRRLQDGGTWSTLAGQPTDDSEMALALARQLIKDGRFQAQSVMSAYRAWRESGPFDIGGTTSRALKGNPNPDSEANGSLMRCSPLGLAFSPDELAWIAPADSELTHPHPLCGQCCRLFTQTISRGIAGMSVAEALDQALTGEGEAHELLRSALDAPPKDFQNQMGWIRIAFANAFHWLGQERPLAEALIWTVRQGGDTDTNAAIAGALLGAFQGLGSVPKQWQLSVLTCRPDRSNHLCQQPRPRDYWPVDALNLAELLLEVRCAAVQP